ncbi:MAG: bifunctional 2-C-methyl-D-erythritol 4-phosphate cytidylyltransferase/2-C-methyl-D-erythritol 2,4-cyclodiphosphate synthase [Alphaproteobacteria bacterium]|jgi:2-C-methyl-D-erythritol 4-phosphate cytidylyltransferase/2-C-methyl-D-erythritol 2,4-cyclodiphosphate synthase|nr:bifunctional 2-C-methyl-D-erythritol 4-phosphate cytidylyltransferase/2-C-methyl-D-erythritol 2,4-cyclodiphosphate synthase [Alphaproteobacteria bacterium]MDP6832347.1 bifunctional 2-C-methyl-D-erythritol 4-phosphate cytidylyltransferase/2-C-methyl-D-erythritol 2,4-cyclodiphosphate synthase [Alphaproteobacteria bacterium]MDP6875712.1 bifunctional 2-C-methyl-D-erythritol 4-phosphate cytidylyltransferase/2-C-methyl-D-erythritol 2,4-cyclodiphosphate synthase [Alphaproteobacteria bacterium]
MASDDNNSTVALVVAAGRGSRMGGPVAKQYQSLAGIPVLRHSLLAFCHHPAINAVAAVIGAEDGELYEQAAAGLEMLPPISGGDSRQQSVLLGLRGLAEQNPDRVLIHDGARPFVSATVINNVLAGLDDSDGAIAAMPVVDSLKQGGGGLITDEVPREGLWQAQTPQGFAFSAILGAHEDADTGHTDDASLARAAGLTVALVAGAPENSKITTAEDLARADGAHAARLFDVRVGQGFDVHRFETGSQVRLCGVDIPHDAALAGHSDADVALHAVTDAILGAIGDGDIGRHFPPSEAKWRDADSARFVSFAVDRVHALGGRLAHLDLTIICEAPRIAPHHEAMAQRLGDIVGLDANRISVKATTTERLGFTGRNEGIAAQATATVRLPI